MASTKKMLTAVIILGVITLAFGAGFFTLLGIEFLAPAPDDNPYNPIIVDQDLHVEGTYNKDYNESSQQVSFLIPFSEYYHYRMEVERKVPHQTYIRPYSVMFIAEYIRDHVYHPEDDENVIMGILSFIQDRGDNNASMHYIYDSVDGAKFPIEFFVEGGGDCEDAAIAFMSLATALRYEVVICYSPGHAFAAIKMDTPPIHQSLRPAHPDPYTPFFFNINGDFYYTVECTGYGWMIGQLPGSIPPATVTWEPVEV